MKFYVALNGAGEIADVGISEDLVLLEPTYISLSSQKTIKIYNRSDVPVTFRWKSCSEVSLSIPVQIALLSQTGS